MVFVLLILDDLTDCLKYSRRRSEITFGAAASSFSINELMQKNSASLRTSSAASSGGRSLLLQKLSMCLKNFPSRSIKYLSFSSLTISCLPLNITASIDSSYFVKVDRLVTKQKCRIVTCVDVMLFERNYLTLFMSQVKYPRFKFKFIINFVNFFPYNPIKLFLGLNKERNSYKKKILKPQLSFIMPIVKCLPNLNTKLEITCFFFFIMRLIKREHNMSELNTKIIVWFEKNVFGYWKSFDSDPECFFPPLLESIEDNN
ncbi:hypothetical protein BpHYR1_048114 [Brachionus plicatilis]|uniref:Uncharacterized protein n=1 Tax=Brachionus plicatilis TaxID=10195 RepID=A0A3M7Q7V8_BRAPC|nr:hypothetical protein BpHYR1_048114 [Brachionus plicatilis]